MEPDILLRHGFATFLTTLNLALGHYWRFWSFGLKGGGGGELEDFGDKGGSQMVDHKNMQGVCKF